MDAKTIKRMDDYNLVKQLLANGYSTSEIAATLKLNESTVRSWAATITDSE